MIVKTTQQLLGYGEQEKRRKDDFYATPGFAIDALLDRESFSGRIWEPACGDGAISKKLIERGHDVYSSDLVDRGYGHHHFDFLKSYNLVYDCIITNPPFNIGTKFTLHALRCTTYKVAIFNRLTFLEGKERSIKLYSQNKLENVYVFSERISFGPTGKGGMLAFAWFVFNHQYHGHPKIIFI